MKAMLVGVIAISALLFVGTAQADGAALAKSSGCMNCHNLDNKLVGPALKDVGAKYTGQDDAATYLAGKIQKGSSGVWGAIPMPPNAAVNDENAKVLAEWLLTLKK